MTSEYMDITWWPWVKHEADIRANLIISSTDHDVTVYIG